MDRNEDVYLAELYAERRPILRALERTYMRADWRSAEAIEQRAGMWPALDEINRRIWRRKQELKQETSE